MKPNRIQKQAKTARNAELVMDYKNEMPIKEMEKKYGITRSRIYQILARY